MSTPKNVGWTDEMDATIVKAIREGRTAAQTAALIGCGKSRSAVLGRAHRLGLSFPVKVQIGAEYRALAPNEPRPAPKNPRVMVDGKRVRVSTLQKKVERVGGPKSLPTAKVTKGNFNPIAFAPHTKESALTSIERRTRAEADREKHLAAIAAMEEERRGGVPFMKRGQFQCAAMFGRGMHANCCGRPVTLRPDGQASSYCAEHYAVYHSGHQPRPITKLDFTDAGIAKVKVKRAPAEDAELEEEIEPVDRLIAGDEDDDQQQAA